MSNKITSNKSTGPYGVEYFPENIKYVRNSPYNIESLNNLLSINKYTMFAGGSYLKINLTDKKWNYEPDYAWLYRNQPPLITIEELKLILDE